MIAPLGGIGIAVLRLLVASAPIEMAVPLIPITLAAAYHIVSMLQNLRVAAPPPRPV